MKEQLEQAKQFYMDLWAYHLQSVLYLKQEQESDAAWQKIIQGGQDLIDRYGGDDRLRIFVGRIQDDVANAVRGMRISYSP